MIVYCVVQATSKINKKKRNKKKSPRVTAAVQLVFNAG